jgi:hypothetical protein
MSTRYYDVTVRLRVYGETPKQCAERAHEEARRIEVLVVGGFSGARTLKRPRTVRLVKRGGR